jgi:hypothetical protein
LLMVGRDFRLAELSNRIAKDSMFGLKEVAFQHFQHGKDPMVRVHSAGGSPGLFKVVFCTRSSCGVSNRDTGWRRRSK